METSNNSISLDKINNGKEVCTKCNKGYLKPLNPKYKINHCFICDYCGSALTIEPNIIVD